MPSEQFTSGGAMTSIGEFADHGRAWLLSVMAGQLKLRLPLGLQAFKLVSDSNDPNEMMSWRFTVAAPRAH